MQRRRIGLAWLGIMVLGLTACLPQGVRLPQSEFLSIFERKSGLIAYLGADGNIYVVDQSGGTPTAVTKDAQVGETSYRVYSLPAWTADGRRLAFAAYEGQTNADPSKNSLYVAERDGSHLVEAYTSPDYLVYYGWAPDGQQVSLLSATPGQTLALKLVPAAGGDAQVLDAGAPFYWAWAPDSQTLLVHANGEGGRLAFLQLGASVTERGLPAKPTAFKAPAYSPDGRQILFAGLAADGQRTLYLADRDGGQPRSVAEFPDDIAFVWSPDGSRVAYIPSPQLAGPITVLDPSGAQAPVTLPEDAYGFFWSPDSRSLAYFALETVAPDSTGTPTPAVPQRAWALKIMDARTGAARRLTYLQPTDRFLQLLPYFDQYHQSLTIWSPDSQNLVVAAYSSDNAPGIYIVPASGNLDPRFIADGLVAVWSWK